MDLTCRPGGHVLPERVTEDLPKAHELLKAAGIRIAMITTAMTDADEAHAEAIVQTAAKLGIRYAKIGYFPYQDLKKIQETLVDARAKLRDLAMLFRQHGLRAGFHNHSGMNVGAAMWDVWHLIRELPPEAIGSYFDLGHATAEGGASGWKIGMHLLMPRIIMLAVKDVRAGDTIVVPQKIEARTPQLALWQTVASIIGSVALTAAGIAVVGR
ncbi:TIM barrel protein [Nitrospirales bacterium NOB]|nr:TIM barrel protein [Nitrospirales bacterium NOB]